MDPNFYVKNCGIIAQGDEPFPSQVNMISSLFILNGYLYITQLTDPRLLPLGAQVNNVMEKKQLYEKWNGRQTVV